MLQVIPHVVGLVALYFVSPIQLLSMHQTYSLSDLYGNLLKRFTLRKWSCEVLSLQFLNNCIRASGQILACLVIFRTFVELPLTHMYPSNLVRKIWNLAV